MSKLPWAKYIQYLDRGDNGKYGGEICYDQRIHSGAALHWLVLAFGQWAGEGEGI